MDRLNVRNILRRKKHKLEGNNYNRVLCPNGREETTFHLFFTCPFSLDCWRYLNIEWNYNTDFYTMMDEAKSQFGNEFMEVFMIASWLIWKQRNTLIFNRSRPTFQLWRSGFLEETICKRKEWELLEEMFSLLSFINWLNLQFLFSFLSLFVC
jgi:hypothetical protein